MTKARDIMTEGVEFIAVDATAADAAQQMASQGVGALPVCRTDGHLAGMVTDRDLVVKVLAAGKTPNSVTVGDLADQDEVVTIGADDSVEEAVQTMKDHKVRRLPVIDGDRMVGLISQGDIATELSAEQVGDLVVAISEAP